MKPPLTPWRLLAVVVLAASIAAGLVVVEIAQAHAAASSTVGVTLDPAGYPLEPTPPAPLPSQQPWIEAPGGQDGTPVNPAPSKPPPGTLSGPGKVCQGKTKMKTHGLNPNPEMWCEVSPGTWVKVDPNDVEAVPGQKACAGKQKQLINPAAPLPDTLCETTPGKWEQDPTSPYKAQSAAKKDQSCGFGDVACYAKQAINGWFADLIASAKKPILDFVARSLMGTPEISSTSMQRVREMWGVTRTIANTCFVLLVTVAGVLLMAGQSLPGQMSARDLLPRVVLAFLAVNLSLIFLSYGIDFANGLAEAFLRDGPQKINPSVLADVIGGSMTANIASGGTFFAIIALVVLALALCLAFIYIIRIALTMVLVSAAPLALMFHALPQTDGLARFWWRSTLGVGVIPVLQALTAATAAHLLFTETKDSSSDFAGVPTGNDHWDLLLAVALLYVMVRIPSWTARTIWRAATPRMLTQLAKTFILYRGIGALMNRAGQANRTQAAGRGTGGTGRATRNQPLPDRRQPGPRPQREQAFRPRRPGRGRGSSWDNPPPFTPRMPPLPPEPGDPEPPGNGRGGRPVQLPLFPTPARPSGGAAGPMQLALPIPVSRVPRPTPPPAAPPAPRPVRPPQARQLMLPGMPRRPVPHRQMVLFRDPPRRTRRNR
ncbi:hypothetical protein J4573_45235 [Actinomadura barringtoniae]|uniref:TrbL/VirB6 plasmid conjugal transfer protein n=1 Tax=Actinomadura barringtoniae TaxID=1427535 RepID=A0A939T8P2_9ACTN|nr:hypothetical protein [Actinomadura barringtoniae]MBO2454358.1 hypothetical protein [Actinomadura barringtoniae]